MSDICFELGGIISSELPVREREKERGTHFKCVNRCSRADISARQRHALHSLPVRIRAFRCHYQKPRIIPDVEHPPRHLSDIWRRLRYFTLIDIMQIRIITFARVYNARIISIVTHYSFDSIENCSRATPQFLLMTGRISNFLVTVTATLFTRSLNAYFSPSAQSGFFALYRRKSTAQKGRDKNRLTLVRK